ncbi:hypothetical protein TEA_018557 [Camellia sinensis var. sinensis]|uniref:FH2 domain-containing protein n=1 Tax=Camellia sinensis var. sinensis TaxID=542762 RepID=A0A4S4ESH0_CAMSN|nr:hypothetical protein TEA_018557 [Camellia sinensis var. sinensis]
MLCVCMCDTDLATITMCNDLLVLLIWNGHWLAAVELGLLKGRHPLLKDVNVMSMHVICAVNVVLALDSLALDIDQVENLIKFCPTKEETTMLKNYNGTNNMLGKYEQWSPNYEYLRSELLFQLGTDLGAALVNLETGVQSWVFCCKTLSFHHLPPLWGVSSLCFNSNHGLARSATFILAGSAAIADFGS